MPADTVTAAAREYDGVSAALELAALSAFVVLLRYAAVLYANHLLATLGADDLPPTARSGDGAVAVDVAAIARMRCFVFVGRGGGGEGDDDADAAECAVCLGAVQGGETARALPCCAHAFHARCVDAWLRLRPTCPVCRATCS